MIIIILGSGQVMSPRGKAWKDITSMFGEVLEWKESKTHGDVAL